MKNLTTKTALITGASSGIGFEMAKVFGKNGYNLVLVARRIEPMQEIVKMFPTQKVQIISKDLSQIDGCKELVVQLEKVQIDVLINNAGFGDHGELQTTDVNKQISMINLNVSALTYLTHIFGSKMVALKQGKIINLASTAAFMPGPSMATYFATKAFVLSFSQALAKEWAKYGVQVMALCPGGTASEFQKSSNLLETNFGKSKNIPTSAEVAQYAFDELKKGKTVTVHGFVNKIITFLPRILPKKLVASIVERAVK